LGMPVAAAIRLIERWPPDHMAPKTCWQRWRRFIPYFSLEDSSSLL